MRSWVVMVQREVGERLAAAPGDPGLRRALGARAARVRRQGAAADRAHRVPPGPERRLGAGRAAAPPAARPIPALRALVHEAFAHRRKALAGSLALGAGARAGRPRARAGGAGRARPPGRRARRAAVAAGVPRARRRGCAHVRLRARAPAKVNLCLFLGAVRADGRHELVTVFESVSLCDELELTVLGDGRGRRRGRLSRGARGRTWSSAALRRPARAWVGRAAGAHRDRQADPGRRRDGRRLGRRRGGAAAGGGRPPGGRRRGRAWLPRSSAPTSPASSFPGCGSGPGLATRSRPPSRSSQHAFVIVPLPFELSTADVYREADRLGAQRSDAELASRCEAVRTVLSLPGGRVPAELAVNDLEPAALSLRPEIADVLDRVRAAGAESAFVCGSGPTVAGVLLGQGCGAPGPTRRPRRAFRRRYPGACAAVPVSDVVRPAIPAFGHNSRGPVMSNQTITYLVGAGLGVLGLVAFCVLVVVPRSPPTGAARARRRGGAVAVCARRAGWRRRPGRRTRRVRVAAALLGRLRPRSLRTWLKTLPPGGDLQRRPDLARARGDHRRGRGRSRPAGDPPRGGARARREPGPDRPLGLGARGGHALAGR